MNIHPTPDNTGAGNQLRRLDLNDPLACQKWLRTHKPKVLEAFKVPYSKATKITVRKEEGQPSQVLPENKGNVPKTGLVVNP